MKSDDVRALLAAQPQSETLPHPEETVAILRQDVVNATAESSAVESWIAERGGERRLAPARRSTTHQAGEGHAHFDGPFLYYIIPVEALRA